MYVDMNADVNMNTNVKATMYDKRGERRRSRDTK
jgi:hypothetical protein